MSIHVRNSVARALNSVSCSWTAVLLMLLGVLGYQPSPPRLVMTGAGSFLCQELAVYPAHMDRCHAHPSRKLG
jgi:hypothetical protein